MRPSYHIPGIPYVGSNNVDLSRLSSACAFLTLPRSPVKFRKNIKCRDLPSTPSSKLPRPYAPDAPRHRGFQAAPTRAEPFPALALPKPSTPPPPSPSRYCVWPTPSMSKNGVRRALLNRVFDPPTPPPSRIPVAVCSSRPAISCVPPCLSTPRKKKNPLIDTLTRIICDIKSALSKFVTSVPDVSALSSVTEQSVDSRSASPLRSILVRSRSDKVRAKKGVRFGDVTVREVDYWVHRKRHVFQDGGLWALGRLQGWRVTPLDTPNEDGETEKYMTMWGHEHSSIHYHTNMPPCPHHGCAWERIATFRRKLWWEKGINVFCDHEKLMQLWSERRQRARDQGHWKL